LPALVEGRIAAVVVDALLSIGRAPASAGPRRLGPLRARPALGVSVAEQQSHYCDTEQNKTDRAHGSSPGPSFRSDLRCKTVFYIGYENLADHNAIALALENNLFRLGCLSSFRIDSGGRVV